MPLIRSPANESEFKAYYALRWKILREPWNQPPGSEKDEFEQVAVHLAAWDDAGNLIGVGRLHRVSENAAKFVTWRLTRPSEAAGLESPSCGNWSFARSNPGFRKLSSIRDRMRFRSTRGMVIKF